MSERQPLHDILCEAAGYLVKLGTNLQLRAERLRQRKLSNKHSVRKVTDKVLLICDLSKKSIEKVEDVVRDGVSREGLGTRNNEHRLSTVSCDGGTKSSGRIEKTKLRKVGKLLLRIPKRVHLAHFESCRVTARALPRSFLDKYPIYLHCNTWKERRNTSGQTLVSSDENDINLSHQKKKTMQTAKAEVQNKIIVQSKLGSDTNSSVTHELSADSRKSSHSNLKQTKMISNETIPESKQNQTLDDCSLKEKSKPTLDDMKKNHASKSNNNVDGEKSNKSPNKKSESENKLISDKVKPKSKPCKAKDSSGEHNKSIPERSFKYKSENVSSQKEFGHSNHVELSKDIKSLKEFSEEHNDFLSKAADSQQGKPLSPSTENNSDSKQMKNSDRGSKSIQEATSQNKKSELSVIGTVKNTNEVSNEDSMQAIPKDHSVSLNIRNDCKSSVKDSKILNSNESNSKIEVDASENEKSDLSNVSSEKLSTEVFNEKTAAMREQHDESLKKKDKHPSSLQVSKSLDSDTNVSEFSQLETNKKSDLSNVGTDELSTESLNDNKTPTVHTDHSDCLEMRNRQPSSLRDDSLPVISRSDKSDSESNQLETHSITVLSESDAEKVPNVVLNEDRPTCVSRSSSVNSENSEESLVLSKRNTPRKRLSVLTISSSDDDATQETSLDSHNIDSACPPTLKENNHLLQKEKEPAENVEETKISQESKTSEKLKESTDCHSPTEDSSQNSSKSAKPMIKCIDLSKLLKSPLKDQNSLLVETHSVSRVTEETKHFKNLQKEEKKNMNQLAKTKESKTVNQKSEKMCGNRKKGPHSKPKKKLTLDKYWTEISYTQALELRELLPKFTPKEFKIRVENMAIFSNRFLEKHNLRQITKAGLVVAKLSERSSQVTCSAKIDLLNESSDSSIDLGQRTKKNNSEIGKTRRKHVMESIRAKRMLLTHSSSSDTDDSQGTPKQIKNTLKETSSEEENKEGQELKNQLQPLSISEEVKNMSTEKKSTKEISKQTADEIKMKAEAHKRKLLDSSSSSLSDEETIVSALNMLEKEMKVADSSGNGTRSSEEKQSQDQTKTSKASDQASSKTSSISQVDGNDDGTTGSDSEMGRSTRSRTTASAQNSDATDNDDRAVDGLTNLKNLHRKNKGKESPSSTSDGSKSKKKSKGDSSKGKALEDDILLEVESKSSSGPESEDIPGAPGLNGEPLGELARADLLDEDSDSAQDSAANQSDDAKSNGKAKADRKKRAKKGNPGPIIELDSTDSDDSEAEKDSLKVRRRKQPLVSSGSEAGGSAKKKAEKDSDYDNGSAASDDSAEHFKKSKRKAKKSSDSDSAGRSSSDGRKKKRRRIKQVKESEGSEESDSDNDGKKGGRKNIRKVMGKDQLEEATKKAAREERERMARIAERQKQYNNTAFDESGKPDEVKLDKVVLDYDPETKEPLIQVDPGIVKKLKPHQANGIKFMWDACFESVKQIKKGRGSGCILAHCMGLGKTLQVVSLTHTLLAHGKLTGVRRVLVVCPLSTVLNWVNEFNMWTQYAESNGDIDIYELSRHKQNHERSYQLKEWMETGGVCVLGYEMFRNLSADNPKKFRKKMLTVFQESLVNPGPDLVVCDEGHLLKNEKTSLSQSMNRVRTLRRIVLTGTPLQNNLKEYYCMVQFVKPNLLGKYNEYLNRFVNPITNGQYTNSTEQDIRVMKRRSHVLHKMLDGAVQRRDYGVLAPFLPPKHEYVLFITLTEVQVKLYQHYLDNYSRRQQAGGRNSGFLFPDFQALQRIWTHPLVLKANSERYEIAQQKKRDREEEDDSEGSIADFLDDDSTPEESTTEEESDVSEGSDDSRKKSKKKSGKKSKGKTEASSSRRSTRANPDARAEELDMKELKDPDEPRHENPTEWWIKLVEDKELEDMRNSNKLILLFDILRQCEAIGDKLLVFSQSLYSLDLIEQFLSRIDEATQMGKVEETLGNHVGSWAPGVDYFRLDGSTSCENRSIWCKNFNREDNPRARLFLISTRAGGLGINLVAANRVVIFDVSWNPSHDVQSIFRVYRFGQKKPCYVYRFLAMGTMEEKIYERQVTKQAISKRVIDEQQIDRHYNENDLQELYTFQPEPEQPRPVPLLPKDRLFAEMLKEHDKLIYRYHEHDSLLENKEEETLTEEERRAAWEDFENEKNRPPPVPFTNPVGYMPHMNGMNNMMQQQLALATMLSMLRKDYPGLSEQQIANILPQLLYADPSMYGGYDFGLMQKMRALSSMAGANMMGGMGVGPAGGALGFQPTWQQQQQMQLQRLQQQQAMNAAAGGGGPGVKYYAGGLGSRDPMSMALQQKQQREMLLSSTGERLRDMLVGAAPRAHAAQPPPPRAAPPAHHPADIVNLDDSE